MSRNEIQFAVRNNDPKIKLIKNLNAKSNAWARFCQIRYEDSLVDFVCCMECKTVLAHTSRHGTGTLLRHRCASGHRVKKARKKLNSSAFVDVSLKSYEYDYSVEGYSDDAADFKIESGECSFDAQPEEDFLCNQTVASEKYNSDESEGSQQNKNETNYDKNCTQGNQRAGPKKLSRLEESNINSSNDASILAAFDPVDLFFLSMSKMTKQLPKCDQSKIKFEISNLILTAEMKHHATQA